MRVTNDDSEVSRSEGEHSRDESDASRTEQAIDRGAEGLVLKPCGCAVSRETTAERSHMALSNSCSLSALKSGRMI